MRPAASHFACRIGAGAGVCSGAEVSRTGSPPGRECVPEHGLRHRTDAASVARPSDGRRSSDLAPSLRAQFDPILARFAGLRRLPSTRTVSGWLAQLSSSHVARLVRLNSEVVGEALNAAGRARLTIDVDGSVVSTGQTVEGAKRGFNPHHRKVPSYYPITAYEAQSGQILRVENRPGNVHDGKASLEFLEALVDQIHETVGRPLATLRAPRPCCSFPFNYPDHSHPCRKQRTQATSCHVALRARTVLLIF